MKISDLEIRLDKQDLLSVRITYLTFDVVLPKSNLFDGTLGPGRETAEGNGWVILKPVDSGSHSNEKYCNVRQGRLKVPQLTRTQNAI